MLPTFELIHLFYLGVAVVLELVANFLMKRSSGLKRKWFGFAAIVCVLAAFTALSFSIEGIQLSVAYSIWGGVGMVATAIMSIFLFSERIKPIGWMGMFLIMVGVVLMKMS